MLKKDVSEVGSAHGGEYVAPPSVAATLDECFFFFLLSYSYHFFGLHFVLMPKIMRYVLVIGIYTHMDCASRMDTSLIVCCVECWPFGTRTREVGNGIGSGD